MRWSAELQQALLDGVGQRRRAHVEAQVDRVGNLVDVLAAGALRAHRGDLDLALRYDDVGAARHGPTSPCSPCLSCSRSAHDLVEAAFLALRKRVQLGNQLLVQLDRERHRGRRRGRARAARAGSGSPARPCRTARRHLRTPACGFRRRPLSFSRSVFFMRAFPQNFKDSLCAERAPGATPREIRIARFRVYAINAERRSRAYRGATGGARPVRRYRGARCPSVRSLSFDSLPLQLDVQAHLVGRVGEAQRVLVADAAGLVQVEQRLVEGLHAELARLLHDFLDARGSRP